MTQHLQLDAQDQAALRKLDSDFTISADGEVAVVSGEMELTVKRPDHDGGNQFLLTLTFPGGEELSGYGGRSCSNSSTSKRTKAEK